MILLNQDQSRLVDFIKQHINVFLQQMDDFYPFGVQIKSDGSISSVAAYLEEDLSVHALITMLEDSIAKKILEKTIHIGAVAVAIKVFEHGQDMDGVQIRFYQAGAQPDFINLAYRKVAGVIEFL